MSGKTMSRLKTDGILGLTQQDLVRWLLILLVIVTALGSLVDGGALSSNYGKSAIMVYISIIIMLYLIVIAIIYAMGLNPNKFELIFVPTLLIGMIVIVLFQTNLIPEIGDEDPSQSNNINSSIDSSDVLTATGSNSGNTNSVSDFVTTFVTNQVESPFQALLRSIGPAIVFTLLLIIMVVALYILIKRQKFLPDIGLTTVQEYAKSKFESNKSIIEYYILTSNKIEEIKGKAPDWFTPTFFASHVTSSPGPPLSSYFERLTQLYELARFSNYEMSESQVIEAKELYLQILNQIETLFMQYRKKEEQTA